MYVWEINRMGIFTTFRTVGPRTACVSPFAITVCRASVFVGEKLIREAIRLLEEETRKKAEILAILKRYAAGAD